MNYFFLLLVWEVPTAAAHRRDEYKMEATHTAHYGIDLCPFGLIFGVVLNLPIPRKATLLRSFSYDERYFSFDRGIDHCLLIIWSSLSYIRSDHFTSLDLFCTADALLVRAHKDQNRVFEFLHGLHRDFDQIIIQILGRIPVPSLSETYNIVQQEYDHRQSWSSEGLSSGSSLAISHFGGTTSQDFRPQPSDKDHLMCDYCGRSRHTRDTCFKLHGPLHREVAWFLVGAVMDVVVAAQILALPSLLM
ncbi:hypothetical protein KSP39_PZI022272 [Platanthera zijinensis]|uniref:Uncharacterized protein n=1 Tax=Platanthera zijinensis TaxID=2320716 RepID=A0AAP0AWF0_9ASPA